MTPTERDRSGRTDSGTVPPHDLRDDLEAQRALTAEFRQALDAFAEDAQRIVRNEVSRVTPDADAIEEMVRRVAREEAGAALRGRDRQISWVTVGVASLAALLASGVGWTVARWAGDGPAPPAVEAVQAAVPAAVTEPVLDGPARAARYDSLFAARDSTLVTMTGRILPGADSVLADAVAAWRSGDTAHDARVHDVLVQLRLREVVDSTLVLDGRILRRPTCAGASCAALARLWEQRAGRDGYPDLPEDPAADTSGLAIVERLLVLDGMVSR